MTDFTYKILKNILFKFDPEFIHNFAVFNLRFLSNFEFVKKILIKNFDVLMPVEVMGMRFRNPFGLSAGFDKNAEIYNFLRCFGFGFIEVGSVTLKAQIGNKKPRLWRVVDEISIVNHMGLNNIGAYKVRNNIEKNGKDDIVLGINIAKNNDCDFKDAYKNIGECFRVLKDCGDFFVVNISCPNVSGFMGDFYEYVSSIVKEIKNIDNIKPIFIKISPDLDDKEINQITSVCEEYNCGMVVNNTTKRKILKTRVFDNIDGGTSGMAIKDISENMISKIRSISKKIVIISSGGIFDYDDIEKRRNLGAQLFEVYTSFIYFGPGIVKKLSNKIF